MINFKSSLLILESLGQSTGLLAFKTVTKLHSAKELYYLAGIDNARFKRPVEPWSTKVKSDPN